MYARRVGGDFAHGFVSKFDALSAIPGSDDIFDVPSKYPRISLNRPVNDLSDVQKIKSGEGYPVRSNRIISEDDCLRRGRTSIDPYGDDAIISMNASTRVAICSTSESL
jgi:hypothetical protein